MKRLLILLSLSGGLISHAYGQTYPGQFPANTVFGNSTGSTAAAVPGQVLGTQISAGTIGNSNLSNMAANTVKCNFGGSPAAPQDCTQIATKPTATTTGLSILETTDTSWSIFGTPTSITATHGTQNSIVGFILNDATPATNAFPGGVNGYGKVNLGANGNTAFGVFGLGELASTGGGVGIAAEFTCRNNSGNAPDVNLPPNEAIGTGTSVCNSLQVTAGGGNNSSLGIFLSSEAGSSKVFNTGIYLGTSSHAQFGIFVDAQPTGTQTSEVLKNNGAGLNLQIQTTSAITAGNSVVSVVDSGAVSRASIKQIGDFAGHAWLSSGQSVPTLGTCTGLGTGSSCSLNAGSNDGVGTVTLTTGTAPGNVGNVPLTFASAIGSNTSACQETLVSGAAQWPSPTMVVVGSQSTTGVTATWQNAGGLAASTTYQLNYFCPGH